MVSNCWVPNCPTGNRDGRGGRIGTQLRRFGAPRNPELLEKWARAIPRDIPLKTGDKVCELHFKPEDIVKENTIDYGTHVETLSRKACLAPGAVPSIFPNCPAYLSKTSKCRKPPRKRSGIDTSQASKASGIQDQMDTLGQIVVNEPVPDVSGLEEPCNEPIYTADTSTTSSSPEISLEAEHTCERCENISLADWWSKRPLDDGRMLVYEICLDNEAPKILKSAVIDYSLRTVTLQNNSKSLIRVGNPVSFNVKHEINEILDKFHNEPPCPGIDISRYTTFPSLPGGLFVNGIWRSTDCHLVRNNDIRCPPCTKLLDKLRMTAWRSSKQRRNLAGGINNKFRQFPCNSKEANLKSRKSKEWFRRRSLRLKGKIRDLKTQVSDIMKKFSSVKKSAIEDLLSSITDDQARRTVNMILKRSSLSNAKSMRYEADWLLECMMLRIKSPATYNHLRASNVLPLPHPTTLGRLIRGMSCHFGFNDFAFEAIKQIMSGKSLLERTGVLCFDEVSITANLDFNTEKHTFDGFIEINSEQESELCGLQETNSDDTSKSAHNILGNPNQEDLADHALVFMFRPLMSKWVQPFGVFATRSAAKGDDLYRLLIAALIRLESVGARVLCTVCDGAQSNKSLWKLAGVGVKNENGERKIQHYIPHPTVEDAKVFFLLDIPHGYKCMRNHIFKYLIVQAAGEVLWKKHIDYLFDADTREGGLRVCPQLTATHINPTNFQKMCVRYAVQVFSHSVSSGLALYREHEELNNAANKRFQHTQTMEQLFTLLDKAFDIMNARCPKDAINKRNWSESKKILLGFFNILEQTEAVQENAQNSFDVHAPPFVSSTTNKALRVTIRSFIDIIEHLFQLNMPYVLTGKMNQDCLERFFGIIRSAGGGEEKPTTSSFLQLFRLLSLYYPTKVILRGANVDNDEKMELLTNYKDWLRTKAKEEQTKSKKQRDFMKDILIKGIKDELMKPENELSDEVAGSEDKFESASINDKVVYYVCGYLARKFKRSNKCYECSNSICVGFEGLEQDCTAMHLTLNKTKGGLQFVSTDMFRLMRQVEDRLLSFCKKEEIFRQNAFADLLYSIPFEALPKVGCMEHQVDFMSTLMYDYMIIRFKCIGKEQRNKLCQKNRTDKLSNRKASKL